MPPVTAPAICSGGITARAGRRTMMPTTRPRTTAPPTTSAVTTHPRTVRGTRRPRGPAITSMTTPATTTTHWAPTSTRWGTSRARPPPGAAIAHGRGDFDLAPAAKTRIGVAREIAAHEDTLRVGTHAHAPGQVEVVAAIDAGATDRRVAEPAHLRVNEVFPTGHRIDVLPGAVQVTARLPRRRAGQRQHVVHNVPSLGRRRAARARGCAPAAARRQRMPATAS